MSRYAENDARDEALLIEIRATLAATDPVSQAARKALLARLLAPYEPVIRGLVAADLWKLGRAEVDDWTQETWRRLIEEIVSGKRWEFSFRQIVIARAKFTCRDARRAVSSRGNREIPSDWDSTDERADTEEAAVGQAVFDAFVSRLSRDDARIVKGSWLEGLSSRELGDELGMTANAVDQRKHRIRATLREHVRDA
jgi:RNA polymerase sigma factor (sigma-70 family)